MVGAYGILILNREEPDKIIAARHGSPLVIGLGKNENYLASDVSAVIDFTRNILFLEDYPILGGYFQLIDFFLKLILGG